MTLTADVSVIFADARQVHAEALERLTQGDIRDAAEKAWLATLRATNALIHGPHRRRTRKVSIQQDWAGKAGPKRQPGPISGESLLLQAEFPAWRLFLPWHMRTA